MSTEIIPDVTAIEEAWKKHIQAIRPPRSADDSQDARDYIYASSRRACRRRMVLEAVHPSYFPDFDVDAKARFIRGDQREIDIRQALERVGQLCLPSFTVIGQQERITVKNLKGRKIISGKIDGKIQWESKTLWPFEIKSWSPFLTDRIFEFSDLFRSPWTRAGAYQLLSYLYSMEQPFGLLVLDRPGIPRLIKVDLEENIQLMQDFIDDATACVDHIDAGTLPDFTTDPSECRRCPVFGSGCQPPVSNEAAQLFLDEETILKAERYAELDVMPEIDEHATLEKWAKERFRGVTMAIAGKTLVTGKWQPNTVYELSAEAKQKINLIKKPFAKKVEQGKFFLNVSNVDACLERNR